MRGFLGIKVHPEVRRLLEQNAALREDLASLLGELHSLEHVIKPNLLALYQVKLGPWEVLLCKAQNDVARQKRKLELLQASLNKGETPDFVAIESALDLEFLQWKKKFQEQVAEVQAAQVRLSRLPTPAKGTQVKKLYYALVKKLHPDLHPQVTAHEKELWLQVLAAYESGDLKKLQSLTLAAHGRHDPVSRNDNLQSLQSEHQRLELHILQLAQKIRRIEQEPPFSMHQFWTDDAWVAGRRKEIEPEIAVSSEQLHALEAHCKTLITIHGPSRQFSHN